MSDLGPRGPEHEGESIRFKRNRSWRMSGPASEIEVRQGPTREPKRPMAWCSNCEDAPGGCWDATCKPRK